MDISVIIPFFNARKWIQECISALLSQDYPEDCYEIIMIDNNSTDGTVDAVKQFPGIRLLQETKQGSYCARNRGIKAAEGQLIAFTDPDCRPNVDWLSGLAAAARLCGPEIILGKREFAVGSTSLSLLSDYESVKEGYVFSSNDADIYYGYTNNMAVRRSLFERLGNFIEVERGADTVFVRKAVDECGCHIVQYAPDARIQHLEIGNVWHYYAKKRIYGKSNEGNRALRSARPLNSAERLHLFFRTVRWRHHSFFSACQLLALLSLGMFFYEFGRKAAFKSK